MKKRIFSLVLALMMLLGTVGIVSADSKTILELVDFNSLPTMTWNGTAYDTGYDAATLDALFGFDIGGSPNTDRAYNVVDAGGERGKYIELKKLTNAGNPNFTININYTPSNDVFVYEFDFLRTDITINLPQGINLVGKASDSTTDLTLVNASMNNKAATFDNTDNNKAINFGEEVWNHAKITADLSSKRWTAEFTNLSTGDVTSTSGDMSFTSSSTYGSYTPAKIYKIYFCTFGQGAAYASTGSYGIDNIKAYTMDKLAYASSNPANGETGVSTDKVVKINMSENVDEDSLDAITVTPAADFTASASGKEITIAFDNELAYGTTYTISLGGLKSTTANIAPVSAATVSFTTENAPEIQIMDVKYFSGIGESYQEVSTLTDGALQTARLTIKNNTSAAKGAAIIMAVYNEAGRLVSCQYVSKDLEAGETANVSNGVSVSGCAGGKVKVFSWDSPLTLRPWQINISKDIASN